MREEYIKTDERSVYKEHCRKKSLRTRLHEYALGMMEETEHDAHFIGFVRNAGYSLLEFALR